jgi:parallel beta-helix repeat protein
LVYKKYISRNGKKFGPYYFKSVRGKNGKVKSVYLGTKDPSKKSLSFFGIFFLVALLFLASFFGMFSYQGFQVAEISEIIENSEEIPDVIEENVLETEINEGILEEKSEEEINETEIQEEEPEVELNETINVNETEIQEEEPEVELNETIEIQENTTELEPVLTLNETIVEINNSAVNLTPILNETNMIESNISLISSDIIINQPVRWGKSVKLEDEIEIYSVDIPDDAFDVEFYEIVEGEEVLIENTEDKGNLITGNVVGFFRDIFRFTGKVSYEVKINEIVIKNTPKEFLIQYSTPGPSAKEIEIDNWKKEIIVEGEGFENVLSYTYLENVPEENINLYWWKEDKRIKVDFIKKDLDEDGLIDYIEWTIPHLSVQRYDVEIIILNVQSYPAVGGNWTVNFNTTGVADLEIYPINGTTWDLKDESVDLNFLDIRCGEKSLDYLWVNGSVLVKDYSCINTGHEISKVLTSGKHHLEFKFGDQIAHANNLAISCGDSISTPGIVVLDNGIKDCTSIGLYISTNDVVLDCNGFTIGGDGVDDNSYGIIDSGTRNNVTIINCKVEKFSRGMTFYNDANFTIENNTLTGNMDIGIYLSLGGDNTIRNNNISGNTGGDGYGVYNYRRMRGTNIFDNNTISANGNYGMRLSGEGTYGNWSGYQIINSRIFDNAGTGYGIYAGTGQNGNFENNTIYNNNQKGIAGAYLSNISIINNDIYNSGGDLQNRGIDLSSTSMNTSIINNRISNHTADTGIYMYGHGSNITNNTLFRNKYSLYLRGANNNSVSYNDIGNSTSWGILLWYSANDNYLYSNEVYNSFQHGVYFYTDSDNNILENMSIHNNSRGSSSSYNLYFNTNCDNNEIKSSDIRDSHGRGVYVYDGGTGTAIGNKFIDTVMDEPVASVDFYLRTGTDTVTHLNSTISGLTFSNGVLEKQWYMGVHVNLTDGSDLEGANVTGYNNTDILKFNETTAADGYITRQNMTEYLQTASSTYHYQSNYTVNTSGGDYGTDSQSINLTTNKVINVTFSTLNSAPDDPTPAINSTDGTNQSNQDLNCFDVITDPDADVMNVTFRWYNNSVLWLTKSLNNSYSNGTQVNLTLGNGNTTIGEIWNCSMQTTDGVLSSNWGVSLNLTIKNTPPSEFTNIILNSSSNLNGTDENLTLYFDTGSDNDGDTIYNITDWRKNGSSIAVLNAPFDNNVTAPKVISPVVGAIKDYSTYENNGSLMTISGEPPYNYSSWVSNGVKGGAYNNSLDGNSIPFINFTHTQSLNITNEITVEVWINKNKDIDYQAFVMKGTGAAEAPAGHRNSFLLRAWSSGNVQFRILKAAAADQAVSATTTGGVSVGEWHHIVGVYDRQNVSVYVDGVRTEGEAYTGDIRDSSVDVLVGKDTYYSQARALNGSIDELKIYNFSLSEEQIIANYQAGLAGLSIQTIVNQETSEGDNWTVEVTPTDLINDGVSVNSNDLIVRDTISPSINFAPPTPENSSTSSDEFVTVNVSINETNLEELKFDWDGTNYTFYNDSLILMYNFDNLSSLGENSTHVVDMSQKSNNGDFIGNSVWNNSGKYDGAFDFFGNSNLNVSDGDDSLDLTDNFTLMTWVKWDGAPPEPYPGIISKSNNTWTSNYILGTYGSTRQVYFTFFNGDWQDTQSGLYLKDGEWSFVALTKEGNDLRFLVDGESYSTTETTAMLVNNGTFKIGKAGTAGDKYFNGSIDEVRVWNKSMSITEMEQHYRSNLNKYDADKWNLLFNKTNLTVGNYEYQSFASDVNGNVNSTERRTITKDNTPPPDFTSIVLNSTNTTNLTTENLTVSFTTNLDVDGDHVYNITDWRRNETSIAVLNLPFDNNISGVQAQVKDYTTYNNTGFLGDITADSQPAWTYNGIKGGAYIFSGGANDQFIEVEDDPALDIAGAITVEAWVYKTSDRDYSGIVMKGSDSIASSYLLREKTSGGIQFQVSDSSDNRYNATTGKLGTGKWLHIVGVYNTTNILIYVNGSLIVGDSFVGSIRNSVENIYIGSDENVEARDFNGRIDGVRIYNRSLSQEQILANYLAEVDNHSIQTIVSQETIKGDNWTVALTPVDSIYDGNTTISNNVLILNSAPDGIVLSNPEDGNVTIDRTPTLSWNVGSDSDDDGLTYNLLVDDTSDFSSPVIDTSTGSLQYTPVSDLGLDSVYYWKVNASDGTTSGLFSDIWNFTVESYVSISLITNSISFGGLSMGVMNNTTDDNPQPFVVENQGNGLINISINATTLFDTVGLGDASYQFKIDNSSELGSFLGLSSLINWTFMPSAAVVAIDSLKYEDSTDTAECDILVDVPFSEDAGGKSSTVYFEAGLVE